MNLFEKYKDTLVEYLGLTREKAQITKNEYDQLNPPLQNDPLADQACMQDPQIKYYKYIFPWQKPFGYAANLNLFYNFLNILYHTPFNFIRLCVLLPLTPLYLLSQKTTLFCIDQCEDGGLLKKLFFAFLAIPCFAIFFLCKIPMIFIKYFSPKNLYNVIERTCSLIINAIRLIYFIPFLMRKLVNFILDKIYPYNENIQKMGFRKAGALFVGLLRFLFYLPEFITRSLLFPFGPANITFKIFSFYQSFSPVADTQQEWRDASQKIFGTTPFAQGWNTLVGWFGKALSGTISIAGWSVISYLAFPAVISNVCNWVGITLPQIILGIPALNPAGTIASLISATLIFIGIGVSELMAIEPQKNQKSVQPKKPPTIMPFNDFCFQLINSHKNDTIAERLMAGIEEFLKNESNKAKWRQEINHKITTKEKDVECYIQDENVIRSMPPQKNALNKETVISSNLAKHHNIGPAETEDLPEQYQHVIRTIENSSNHILNNMVLVYTLFSIKIREASNSSQEQIQALFRLYFDDLHHLIQKTQEHMLSRLWQKINQPQEHKEEKVQPHPDPLLFDKYHKCFQATWNYLNFNKNIEEAEKNSIFHQVEKLHKVIAEEKTGIADNINNFLSTYGLLIEDEQSYKLDEIIFTGKNTLKLK